MAERRMFAKTIIDSDAFLDMPQSSQLLYFHLSMRADDDGFINNPKKVQRMVGCSEDDIKILVAKNFIIPFESGVVVIKHWRIHNYIQKDRYKPTVYKEERSALSVKDNGAYTMDTTCIQDVSKTDTQVRLGKSKSKDIDNNEQSQIAPPSYKEVFEYLWSIYPNKKGKKKAQAAFERAIKKGATTEQIRDGLKAYVKYIKESGIGERYIKQGSTFFMQEAWNDDWTPTKDGNKFNRFEHNEYDFDELEKDLGIT